MKNSTLFINKEKLLISLCLLFTILSFNSQAQEICSTNVPVIIVDSGICNGSTTNGDNTNAVDEQTIEGSCFNGGANDVWYQFTAPNTGNLIVSTDFVGGTLFDSEIAIYSDCAGTEIGCSQDEGTVDPGNGSTWLSITQVAVTAGATYFVQVSGFAGDQGTFCLAVNSPPMAGANDECVDAIAVTVNPDLQCGVVESGTIAGATDSNANDCFGTSDDDVWYSFVATQTAHNISLININGGTTDLYIAVWDNCPGAGNTIVCSDFEQTTASQLVVGQTYLVQVYSWTANPAQTSIFDICIGTPPPPGVNDECVDAIAVTVNPDLQCGVVESGTIAGATDSNANDCFGTSDDDVWYSFVATQSNHRISLDNITGGTTDLYIAVWDNCPGTGSTIECSDPEQTTATGLVVGQTYFVQIYSWTSVSGQTSSFDLCIGTPPPPPANDDCTGAQIAQVNTDGTCTQLIQGTTADASGSPEVGSCDFGGDLDVFYRFTAPPLGGITITEISAASDLEVSIFDACGGTEVPGTCLSDLADGQNVTGLVPGTDYILVLWNDDFEPSGPFEVCLREFNACSFQDLSVENSFNICNGDSPIIATATNFNNESVTFSNGTIDPTMLTEGNNAITLTSDATTLCAAGVTENINVNLMSTIPDLFETFCTGQIPQTITIPESTQGGVNIIFTSNGAFDGEIALGLFPGTFDTLSLPPSGSGILGTIDETEIENFGTTGNLTSPEDLYSPAVDNSPGFIQLAPGNYTLYLADSFGDGWNGTTIEVTDHIGNFITDESPIEAILADLQDELSFVNFTIADFTETITGTGITDNGDNTVTFDPVVGVGTYPITMNLEGCVVVQEVSVEDCVNTNDIDEAFELDIFPNPSSEIFKIQIQNETSDDNFVLMVYDNFGRVVEQFQIQNGQGIIEIGATYSSGIYFIRAETEDGVSITKRITKI